MNTPAYPFANLRECKLADLQRIASFLSDGSIAVVTARCESEEARDLLDRNVTSADENLRAERFRLAINRDEHLLGRSIVRLALADVVKAAPADLVFRATPSGKPYLPGQEIMFNITHSSGWVAAAFCLGRPVGIDLEESNRIGIAEIDRLSELVCTPAERRLILGQPADQKQLSFLRIWRLKEAILKAEGSGISEDLTALDLMPLADKTSTLVFYRKKWWTAGTFRNMHNLEVSVATAAEDPLPEPQQDE